MPTPPRRHGFTTLPLKCPHCLRRLKQHTVVLHGGVLACEGCRRQQYIVLLGQVGLAYTVDISRQEVVELFARGASPREVLEALGISVRAA
jgi:hypothetical protein